jgi:hypothetical protein
MADGMQYAATQTRMVDFNTVARIRRKLSVVCKMPKSALKILGIFSVILQIVHEFKIWA